MCKPKEIIKKEYSSFYKSLATAWEYYLVVKQFSFNGVSEGAIFFVPKRAPRK
jgi:HSP90 family molecular chaperone